MAHYGNGAMAVRRRPDDWRGTSMQVEPAWERPVHGLGDWTADIVASFSKESIAKVNKAAGDVMDAVQKAWDAMNEVEPQIGEVARRQAEVLRRFGPLVTGPAPLVLPNWPAVVAMVPLARAGSNLKAGVKRLAALDVLFLELGGVYQKISTGLRRGGLTLDAIRVGNAVRLMDDWRAGAKARIAPKDPSFTAERNRIRDAFLGDLAAKGLRYAIDSDKAPYLEALNSVVAREAGVSATASEAGTSGLGEPVSITLAIFALVKVVIVVVGVVVAIAYASRAIEALWGPANKAMDSAAELQKRKTLREQQVADGTLPRAEADRLNKEDAAATKAETDAAAAAAAKLKPSFFDQFGAVLIPLGIAAGGYVGLKALKVI